MTDQEHCAYCGAELDPDSPNCPSCGAAVKAETTFPPSEAYVPAHVVNPGPTTEAGVARPAPETLPPTPATATRDQVYTQSTASAEPAKRRNWVLITCGVLLLILICCLVLGGIIYSWLFPVTRTTSELIENAYLISIVR
jgi:hypothetical protein